MSARLPTRIQLSRKAGWRMPANTVKIARGTKYGNPFRVGDRRAGNYTRDEACNLFDAYARNRLKKETDWLKLIRGKNLACFCGLDLRCHGDTLLVLANS